MFGNPNRGSRAVDVIRMVMEDTQLSPVEKVLFAILYCRRAGNECRLSVEEITHRVGVGLGILDESLQRLEQRGFIRIKEGCPIEDASTFLSCSVLEENAARSSLREPRP
jgi:uncharacterized protein (UPF0548 family)